MTAFLFFCGWTIGVVIVAYGAGRIDEKMSVMLKTLKKYGKR